MNKIFVVIGSAGEYSDHQEWPVAAFYNETAAKDYAEKASVRAREVQVELEKNQKITDQFYRASNGDSFTFARLAEAGSLPPVIQAAYNRKYEIIKGNENQYDPNMEVRFYGPESTYYIWEIEIRD